MMLWHRQLCSLQLGLLSRHSHQTLIVDTRWYLRLLAQTFGNRTYWTQYKCRPIAILPVDNTTNATAIDICGVILSPDEAVFNQSIIERIDPISIRSPCEYLDPPYVCDRLD